MRFLPTIHIYSILSLTAIGTGGTGFTHPAGGDAAEIPREVHIKRAQHVTSGQEYDASVLAARMGADLFEELDLTAREPGVDSAEFNARTNEDPGERPPQSGGYNYQQGCGIPLVRSTFL
ncbi:hypothetical protein FB451DRAFT_1184245 [Mycena latifolia]|nr:hypothetical protein FB451DRAFT_1184245 [Mycena latifolia]